MKTQHDISCTRGIIKQEREHQAPWMSIQFPLKTKVVTLTQATTAMESTETCYSPKNVKTARTIGLRQQINFLF